MKILGIFWVLSASVFAYGAILSIAQHDVWQAALFATTAMFFGLGSWSALAGRLKNRRFHPLDAAVASGGFRWSGFLVMLLCGLLNLGIAIDRWHNGETWSALVYVPLSLLMFAVAVSILVRRPTTRGKASECRVDPPLEPGKSVRV